MFKCNLKKIIYITTCLVLAVSLCSCNAQKNNDISNEFPSSIVNDNYSIEYDNGRYLLQLTDITKANTYLDSEVRYQPCIYFDNIDEFVSDIKTGQFSEYELGVISTFKKENNKTIICDMNDLYYPTINHEDIKFIVAWYGNYYYHTKLRNDSYGMSIGENTVEDYNAGIDFQSRFNELNSHYITQDVVTDDNHRYIVHSKDAYTTKYEYYTLSDEEKIYYVYKTYHLARPELYDDYVSEDIPYDIEVYWEEDAHYFRAYFSGGVDNITDENIRSMKMHRYTE